MVQVVLYFAILISLLIRQHAFGTSILGTNRIVPLLAVLFDLLACAAGISLFAIVFRSPHNSSTMDIEFEYAE